MHPYTQKPEIHFTLLDLRLFREADRERRRKQQCDACVMSPASTEKDRWGASRKLVLRDRRTFGAPWLF